MYKRQANDHAAHEDLVDYKDYGLTFRFRLAEAAYIPENDNDNKTDQHKFAEIASPMNGKMSAKVYDISGSATAVGREPIVCVELIDSVTVSYTHLPDFSESSTWVRLYCLRIAFTYLDNVVCSVYSLSLIHIYIKGISSRDSEYSALLSAPYEKALDTKWASLISNDFS